MGRNTLNYKSLNYLASHIVSFILVCHFLSRSGRFQCLPPMQVEMTEPRSICKPRLQRRVSHRGDDISVDNYKKGELFRLILVMAGIYISIYLSHSLWDRWGTTRPGNQHSPFLSFLCSPHGVAQFQTRPIPDVMFPSFPLSASHSPSPYSALEDCLGQSRSSCDMPISLRFASFYSEQEFFVGSNGFPNPALHLFVGDVVFVRDVKETSETSHFYCLYLSLYFCC